MTNDAYTAAVTRLMLEPEALTQDDLGALTHVDDRLGQRAATGRQHAITQAAEARHRRAMGNRLDPVALKTARVNADADATLDAIAIALAEPRQRLKALEALNEAWEHRYRTLETQVLELRLDLQKAMGHVER